MFTIGDIRHIAIQIEENGEATYRRAAIDAGDPQVKEILSWMADDERRHAEWFSRLQATKPLTDEQREMEKLGRTLLQDIVKGNTFALDDDALHRAADVGETLAMAKTFEQDTVLFYQFLLGFLDDEETREQLQRIIAEEQQHVKNLEELEQSAKLASCNTDQTR